MKLKERFGLHIKELRTKRNLTQAQLAELIGIATKTQGFIETGRSFPSTKVIEQYAKIFELDVSEVLNIGHIQDYSRVVEEIKIMLEKANEEQIVVIHKFLKSLLY